MSSFGITYSITVT